MKEKILNIIAITLLSLFVCVVVVTLVVIAINIDPIDSLIILSIIAVFVAIGWAAFRVGKIMAQRKINKKERSYLLRNHN